jgi:hypothetical protein
MHLPPPIASKVPTWPGRHTTTEQGGAAHRRPSHTLFEGLTAQKRKDDPASVARRQSLNEQRPTAGFIGQMWNKCVVYSLLSLSYRTSCPYIELSPPPSRRASSCIRNVG